MKKYIFLPFVLFFIILTVPTFSMNTQDNIPQTAQVARTGIKTYINNMFIESWSIDDEVYVAVEDLEQHGYSVTFIPDFNYYSIFFDNHILEENIIRKFKEEIISTNDLDDAWYNTWIQSFYPDSESFYVRYGLRVVEYEETEDIATITFNRSIAPEEFNKNKIRVHTHNGFDVTKYFNYHFDPITNIFTVSPNDDIIFKYIGEHQDHFLVTFDENFQDVNGNTLLTPLTHGFVIPKVNLHDTLRVQPQTINLSENELGDSAYPSLFHRIDNVDLVLATSIGDTKWDNERRRLYITETKTVSRMTYLKRINETHFNNLITHVKVADHTNVTDNGSPILSASDNKMIAKLNSPLLENLPPENYIKLKRGGDFRNYTPIIESKTLKIPEDLPTGVYDLIFIEGLEFENGDKLNQSIYFNIVIVNQ